MGSLYGTVEDFFNGSNLPYWQIYGDHDYDADRIEAAQAANGGSFELAIEEIKREDGESSALTSDESFNLDRIEFTVRASRDEDEKKFTEMSAAAEGTHGFWWDFSEFLEGKEEGLYHVLEGFTMKSRLKDVYTMVAEKLDCKVGDFRLWDKLKYTLYCAGGRHDKAVADRLAMSWTNAPEDEAELHEYDGPFRIQEYMPMPMLVLPEDEVMQPLKPHYGGAWLIVEMRPENEKVRYEFPQSLEPMLYRTRHEWFAAKAAEFAKHSDKPLEVEQSQNPEIHVDSMIRYCFEKPQDTASADGSKPLTSSDAETLLPNSGDDQSSSSASRNDSSPENQLNPSQSSSSSCSSGGAYTVSLSSNSSELKCDDVNESSSPWYSDIDPPKSTSYPKGKCPAWYRIIGLKPGQSHTDLPPSSSLYYALAYLTDRERLGPMITEPDPEKDNKRPNRFNASQARIEIARFAMEHAEKLEASGLLETFFASSDFRGSKIETLIFDLVYANGTDPNSENQVDADALADKLGDLSVSNKSSADASPRELTTRDFAHLVLCREYAGSELDFWVYAIKHGIVIQVWDVPSQTMREYGRGFVEFYAHPDRPGERGVVKLCRWKDGEFDALSFRQLPALMPDLAEHAYMTCFTDQAWEWLAMQDPNASSIRPLRVCSNFLCAKQSINHAFCTRCRAAYYCDRRCQKKHFRLHKYDCGNIKWERNSKRSVGRESCLLEQSGAKYGILPMPSSSNG